AHLWAPARLVQFDSLVPVIDCLLLLPNTILGRRATESDDLGTATAGTEYLTTEATHADTSCQGNDHDYDGYRRRELWKSKLPASMTHAAQPARLLFYRRAGVVAGRAFAFNYVSDPHPERAFIWRRFVLAAVFAAEADD